MNVFLRTALGTVRLARDCGAVKGVPPNTRVLKHFPFYLLLHFSCFRGSTGESHPHVEGKNRDRGTALLPRGEGRPVKGAVRGEGTARSGLPEDHTAARSLRGHSKNYDK